MQRYEYSCVTTVHLEMCGLLMRAELRPWPCVLGHAHFFTNNTRQSDHRGEAVLADLLLSIEHYAFLLSPVCQLSEKAICSLFSREHQKKQQCSELNSQKLKSQTELFHTERQRTRELILSWRILSRGEKLPRRGGVVRSLKTEDFGKEEQMHSLLMGRTSRDGQGQVRSTADVNTGGGGFCPELTV